MLAGCLLCVLAGCLLCVLAGCLLCVYVCWMFVDVSFFVMHWCDVPVLNTALALV